MWNWGSSLDQCRSIFLFGVCRLWSGHPEDVLGRAANDPLRPDRPTFHVAASTRHVGQVVRLFAGTGAVVAHALGLSLPGRGGVRVQADGGRRLNRKFSVGTSDDSPFEI